MVKEKLELVMDNQPGLLDIQWLAIDERNDGRGCLRDLDGNTAAAGGMHQVDSPNSAGLLFLVNRLVQNHGAIL